MTNEHGEIGEAHERRRNGPVTSRAIADGAVRARALDARRSFIVQAPAGSGKTGLLIQRYLTLLARVDDPEEVVAITFTRKAAGEMRERVARALSSVTDDALASPPASRAGRDDEADGEDYDHEGLTLALARAVLARDAARGWQLVRQPGRMRILTIDALCRGIATRMPWVSGLGGDIAIAEDVTPLYREAARETIALLYDDAAWSDPVAVLLAHLDGDLARCEALLVRMLSRRDQWLRYLRPADAGVGAGGDGAARRAELEAALARTVSDELAELRDAVPRGLAADLVAPARSSLRRIPTPPSPRARISRRCRAPHPPSSRAGAASPSCFSPARTSGASASTSVKDSRARTRPTAPP
ncbi:MAG: UvrD-helicase domain-containing protein [Burkholderiales bacterium]|nr:UvrD-helicase domain-containing protein [Burkholderiales bacterium]